MNIGLALLYVAFAVVALWLLGELLVQHRAPAHWRALALLGFLGLVAGVHQGSAVIVGGGVLAFGAGQGLVTRSVKRGEGPHWSLRGPDGALPGPLGRLPLVARVFPAADVPEPDGSDPARRVGTVGPVEESAGALLVEPVEPVGPDPAGQPEPRPLHDGGPYRQPFPEQPFPEQSFPQQAGQPYPSAYPQPDGAGYPYPEPYPQGVPQQAAGYEAAPYPPEYAAPYPQDYAQEYAQEYARHYAAQAGQAQYPQQGDYYPEQPAAPGYGYDPAAQPQSPYYQQPGYQQPAPDDYDALGYHSQGTYQYDPQAQPQEQGQYQQQPGQQPEQPPYAGPWPYS